MKTIIKIPFTFLFAFILASCSDNSIESNETDLTESQKFGDMSISKIVGNDLKSKIQVYKPVDLNNRNSETSQFDFDNPSLITYDDSDLITITVPETNSNSNTSVRNMAFIFNNDNNIVGNYVLDMNKLTDSKVEVINYNENGSVRSHYIIDTDLGEINFLASDQNRSLYNRGCGQEVADCITDKYSNNGWDSVALWIGTAFFPEVIVGVTVICVYESDSCG